LLIVHGVVVSLIWGCEMGPIGFIRRSCGCWGRTLLALVCACAFSAADAAPLTFTVNSPDDVPDIDPSDGVCETAVGNGVCTLRGAIQESNFHDGADKIILQADVTYFLTRVGADEFAQNGDLDILDSVTITGAGPTTVIDGNGGVLGERVFTIYRCIGNVSPGATCSSFDIVSVTMSGITIQHGNSASSGGGIYNAGKLSLQDCVVTANTVGGTNGESGGGIYNILQLTLINSVVSSNISSAPNASGGGIYDTGIMTIDSSTISGNVVSGFPAGGGGIGVNTASTVIIRNSTISNNGATYGGGIRVHNNGATQVQIINSTISGNRADDNGGGVYSEFGSSGLYNVTITKNRANTDEIKADGRGGGVWKGTGTLYLANSIVAANDRLIPGDPRPTSVPDECAGSISSLGYNFLSDIDATNCTISGPYALAVLPLGSLQANGGPTKTHALLPGNPAIDGGNVSGCRDGNDLPINFDQRGEYRPNGPYCDAGAFEVAEIIFQDGFDPGA
ncbi:MAG TPA: right-handed parallel beta-helix repeat-containing protein, partial [Rudaea sp.]|nr:right-handed parallel beta-helix repeat-containing protein [Rudaea sp.]